MRVPGFWLNLAGILVITALVTLSFDVARPRGLKNDPIDHKPAGGG